MFEQLQADSDFTPVGVVRSEKKAKLLRAKFNANEDQVIIGDICSSDEKEIAGWMTDADALVVATSAVPVLKKVGPVSVVALLTAYLTPKIFIAEVASEDACEEAHFPERRQAGVHVERPRRLPRER